MNDKPYYQINITFLPNDKEDAERIFDRCMDIVCGGDIGLGLHVCKSQDWVGSLTKLSENPRFVVKYVDDDYDPHSILIDTLTNKTIYSDIFNYERPEDMSLDRDLAFFVDWMNYLA